MSGRGTVSLLRVPPTCPFCGRRRYVSTGNLGTQVSYPDCHPANCRRARIIALAGMYVHLGEPLPLDDRAAPRRYGRHAS